MTTQAQFAHRSTVHARSLAAARPIAEDFANAQARISLAREWLLDAFSKTRNPAQLLRLIEDLAIVQERLSTIKE